MQKSKTATKRALVTSILSLLVCVSMLLGTTFAWFTDSVTSGKNTITAGNLDIEVYHSNKTETNEKIDSQTDLFKDVTLWEPGAVAYENFTIKNVGTLAAKYTFNLNVAAKNYLNGHDLSEVIKVAVVPNGVSGDRDTVLLAAKSATDTFTALADFKMSGKLVANTGTDTYGIVLYWEPTDNDNQWNVNNEQEASDGKEYLYIDFGVTVKATQDTVESDSFDNQYDAQAKFPVSATAKVVADQETSLTAYDANNEFAASAVVPANTVSADATLLLEVKSTDDSGSSNITVGTAESETTYDVSLVNVVTGAKVENTTQGIKCTLQVGIVDMTAFYHNDEEFTKVDSAAAVDTVGDYYYDKETGIVTFMTDSFSPFSAVYKFSGGIGTEEHPYLIADRAQLEGISDIETYSQFKWIGDKTVEASDWKDDLYLCGSFDGNGVTFNNLDGYLFRAVWNGSTDWDPSNDTLNTYTVKNLTVNADITSSTWATAVVRVAGVHNFVMENVTVHGNIEGTYGVSSFVCFGAGNYAPANTGYQYDGNITFKNCNSDATIVAKSGNAVGFVAHAMMKTSAATIKLDNSNFTGMLSATSASACHYVCGNWINATITDDQSSQKNGSVYNNSSNGWQYIAEGKTGYFAVEQQEKPSNIGDTLTVAANDGATKAVFALQISPNWGNMTSTYMTEEVNIENSSFTTTNLKYFTIRVNAEGSLETGANGNYFDIVNSDFDGTLGSNTIVRVTQYNEDNSIVGVTEINFHDVK